MQHDNQTSNKSEIVYKATISDLDILLRNQEKGRFWCDKWADIEIWPWQTYLVKGDYCNAQDPAIAAYENNVAVVCMHDNTAGGDWDIGCWYSHDNGNNHTWEESIIAGTEGSNETNPALHMGEILTYCAYVKQGNLFLACSENYGATWTNTVQINDVDGSVVARENAIDICDKGVAWVDTRDGNEDIYYAPFPAPVIEFTFKSGINPELTISNVGNAAARNITWSTDVDGFLLAGEHSQGVIANLDPGDSIIVEPNVIFGFGPITMTITVNDASEKMRGFLIGPFLADIG